MQTHFCLEKDESSLLLWLVRSFLYGLSFLSPMEHRHTQHLFSLSMYRNVPSLGYHRAARCHLHGDVYWHLVGFVSASINGTGSNNSNDILGAENRFGNGLFFLGKCWQLVGIDNWQRNVLWVFRGKSKKVKTKNLTKKYKGKQ